jgi:hypothetical protein
VKITRDVIYDLLPAYFAGEASADSRALIEEFFTTDPEFGRMAERFKRLYKEPPDNEDPWSDVGKERRTFQRAKTRVQKRQAAVLWAVGAAIAFGVGVLSMALENGSGRPGLIIGLVFSWVAGATWMSSRSART